MGKRLLDLVKTKKGDDKSGVDEVWPTKFGDPKNNFVEKSAGLKGGEVRRRKIRKTVDGNSHVGVRGEGLNL